VYWKANAGLLLKNYTYNDECNLLSIPFNPIARRPSMARRTKEDALATRHQLLDAAEWVFFEKGVSRTCLQDIALAAGTTRGAIYWHFKNKADLFNAMMLRITLPMEEALHLIGHDPAQDPLVELEQALLGVLRKIATDERVRRVFEVATLKVEYVDELLSVKQRQLQTQTAVMQHIQRSLSDAFARRALVMRVPPAIAAQGLHALVMGLIHTWMLAPQAYDLEAVAAPCLGAYLRGMA
jgi:TetR/AcrR family acrAB operon transcriptional repressor